MTSTTYTLTVATRDDNGNEYTDPAGALRALAADARVLVFSIATGTGFDPETGETEPIVIIAGAGPADRVELFGDLAATHARIFLSQRAIGWSTDTADTYRATTDNLRSTRTPAPAPAPANGLTDTERDHLVIAAETVAEWKSGVWQDSDIADVLGTVARLTGSDHLAGEAEYFRTR